MSHIDVAVGTRNNSAAVDIDYELPVEAVTEAIVNACVHRSYESNGCVQVMLFRNRLEVWSSGSLPMGITLDKLQVTHRSIPVNPTLANPVYLAGYIERLGTGTTDIIAKCEAKGLRSPVFDFDGDFNVTIWRRNVTPNNTIVKQPDETKAILSGPEVIQRDPEEDSTGQLERKIIDILSKQPTLSRARLAEKLGVSERQTRKAMDALRHRGELIRVGSDTSGRWIIVKKNQ